MKTVIQGGTIVNEGRAFVGSVVINGEQIEGITPAVSQKAVAAETSSLGVDGGSVIDATGCYVLPGIIDDQARNPHYLNPLSISRSNRIR